MNKKTGKDILILVVIIIASNQIFSLPVFANQDVVRSEEVEMIICERDEEIDKVVEDIDGSSVDVENGNIVEDANQDNEKKMNDGVILDNELVIYEDETTVDNQNKDNIQLAVTELDDFSYTTNSDGTIKIIKYIGNGGSVIIPEGVTSIANYAFSD